MAHPAIGVSPVDPALLLHTEFAQVLFEVAGQLYIAFDEQYLTRRPAQRLGADDAGPREDIDKNAIRHRVPQNIEKSLAHPIRRRP